MNGSLINDLIRRETGRLRKLGKGYEESARKAVAYVEALHLKEIDARQSRVDAGRQLRRRRHERVSIPTAA